MWEKCLCMRVSVFRSRFFITDSFSNCVLVPIHFLHLYTLPCNNYSTVLGVPSQSSASRSIENRECVSYIRMRECENWVKLCGFVKKNKYKMSSREIALQLLGVNDMSLNCNFYRGKKLENCEILIVKFSTEFGVVSNSDRRLCSSASFPNKMLSPAEEKIRVLRM